jgi:hypothetical protein
LVPEKLASAQVPPKLAPDPQKDSRTDAELAPVWSGNGGRFKTADQFTALLAAQSPE